MAGEKQRPNRRTRFGTIWGELEYVCRRVHYWLHERKDKARARRPLRRLERLLRMVPENELAIIRQEGFALLYELKDELTHAIQHRKREIELMEKLHEDVATGGYEE